MKAFLTLLTLALLIGADGAYAKQAKQDDSWTGGPQSIQARHHDEAGTVTYRGRIGGSGGEIFSLKIGPAHEGKSWVAVYVGARGCLGDTEGQAAIRGDVLELTGECALTIHRSATGATITERDCLTDHGMSCSFDTMGKTLPKVSIAGGEESGASDNPPAAKIEPSAGNASGPGDVVSAVVNLDADGRGIAFGSGDFIRRYFTAQFKASWDRAMAQPGDVLDGDPVTGSQALQSVKLQTTQVTAQTPDSAIVVAKLAVTPLGGKAYPQAVTFTVKRDGSAWKIDDISGPANGSLREYFKKQYGQ